MFRYTKSALVESWLLGAAQRLIDNRHPAVRQGDQEMLWFEWQEALADRLRLLILPEEYYCAGPRRKRPPLDARRGSGAIGKSLPSTRVEGPAQAPTCR